VNRRQFLRGSVALVGAGALSSGFLPTRLPRRPSTAVPDPTGVLITRWAQDPFAFGSYSYLAVGSSNRDRERLAEPVGGRLFFAGEATSTDYAATVHGAYLSGQRAAGTVHDHTDAGATVVVIGAGMAGLAAARALHDARRRVVVVEGRDRIGGRIWTNRDLGPPLDLGASWIEGGGPANPIARLAKRFAVDTKITNWDNNVLYGPDGTEVSDRAENQLNREYHAVLAAAGAEQRRRDTDSPLGDALSAAIAARTSDPSRRRDLDYEINFEIEHEYAADVGDLSLLYWDDDKEFPGPDRLFPNGYGQIVARVAKGLDVRTGQVVRRVDYGGAGVTVTTDGGDVSGDAAIVTLPVGVLQRGIVEFAPPLPDEKTQSIGRLGMGLLDKCYLRFPRVFWDRDADVLNYISADKGRWAEWINIAKYTGEPILIGFNAATYARELEAMTDPEIVTSAMGVLRTIYG
jgi:monoamine oxidase